jgi:hypothetical protein
MHVMPLYSRLPCAALRLLGQGCFTCVEEEGVEPLRVAVTGQVYCALHHRAGRRCLSSAVSGIGLEAVKSGDLGDIQYR